MDEHTSHELAYKKGYEDGKQDALKWIPVTERLPESEELVLILCKNGAMFVGYCGKQYCDFERRWRIKTALNSTKLLNLGRVTHWTKLPEPPTTCHMTSKQQPPKGE
jgi:hypothetical protein